MDAAFIACVLNYQSHFHLNAQNTSSRKQVEDPTMLNKLQGTWMSAIPGEALGKATIQEMTMRSIGNPVKSLLLCYLFPKAEYIQIVFSCCLM